MTSKRSYFLLLPSYWCLVFWCISKNFEELVISTKNISRDINVHFFFENHYSKNSLRSSDLCLFMKTYFTAIEKKANIKKRDICLKTSCFGQLILPQMIWSTKYKWILKFSLGISIPTNEINELSWKWRLWSFSVEIAKVWNICIA